MQSGVAFWLLDRCLPSLVAGVPVFLTGLWYQARRLRGHVEAVTAAQNKTIQAKLDHQTEELTSGRAG